ncbi:MAG: tRNA (guanine-N7)-methyltransferase [Gammaproteobacteria bacterium SG8_47]|nr:MAG: tRNA (guanine-N7)-methyltransferase [Gammaproteobacteria bacterium SG8_47]
MTEDKPQRRIRSFVRREGRLTKGQQRALDELLPRYVIAPELGLVDLDAVFGRHAPHILEIGFGNGAALADMAANHPQNDYLGIEVHRPGVGSLLLRMEELELSNVRVACTDAVDVLRHQICSEALDRVLLFFPDPWHKKRHHKRRLVQPEFLELLRSKLKVGGTFHAATDWEDYAQHMMRVLSEAPGWRNVAGPGHYSERPDYRPHTKFERRGQRLGHGVWDLMFDRVE